ncbi:MAG: PqqD family protein [Anaeroplasmataceae bacterium]
MGINKNYILKCVAGDYMIIPLVDGGYDMSKVFNINEVGAIIYKGLSDNLSDEEIINNILNEYDIDKDTIVKDFNDFKNVLIEKGIYNA